MRLGITISKCAGTGACKRAAPRRESGRRLAIQAAAAFAASLAFILALAPTAPFTKELGVCECGAVRDVLAGSVILPHFSPGTLVHVPPMYWWTAALAVDVLGWREVALRAPSILAVALTVAVLYAWMASSIGRRAALWSMPALLTAAYVADAARQPRMDALLMMFLTTAMVCLERAFSPSPRSPSAADPHWNGSADYTPERVGSRRRALLAGAAALAMSAAILTKGPIGVILPGLTLAIFFTIERRARELFRPDLIATFGGAVAIGAAWYLAALDVGGHQFFALQIAHGFFGRFLGAAVGVAAECHKPFYYFIPRLIAGFLPWSLFYPALAIVIWRESARTAPPVRFALCWFIAVLGFFTISASKCPVYILPLFPALAAVMGWFLADVAGRSRESDLARRLFDWASIAIGAGAIAITVAMGALILSGAVASVGEHLHPTDQRFLEVLAAATLRGSFGVILVATLWILGGAVALTSVVRGRATAQSLGVALIAIAGTLFWYGFLNPALASEQTLKAFAKVVDAAAPAGSPVDYIGQLDCDLEFYSDHTIGSLNNFQCTKEGANGYFILWQDHLKRLAPEQKACLNPIAQSAAVDRHGARVLMIERK
ncbi:ArnT family glycosyltransferase [Candidatus Binatus soli]|jgi:4-amino-4-deoxy-L-arabinose transferase-like glycosyltransferase|uniref:ArnT family glycosyltransferase n=1 Tax=Candidatus Binatus soli TaxID=1953413 RepID=UPI003D0D5E5D